MRQIKFRILMPNVGFDALPKMYMQVQAGGFSQTVPQIWEESKGGWVNAWADNDDPDGVLMQYTGLKDKNGLEIYEGDLVEFKIGSEKVIGAVAYADRQARWVKSFRDSNGANEKDLSSYASSHRVVGNIYENPELLGQTA